MISIKDENKRRQILTGNIWKVVAYVTLPLFFYNFINSFYNVIDQVMVANIGDSSVSAVAIISQIKSLISSLWLGLAGGGSILVSRAYGEGKIDVAKKYANVMFTMALIVCVIIAVLCIPFSKQILLLTQVPDDLIEISNGYFMLQFVEQIIIVINSVFIGLEESKGNTKTIFMSNIIIMLVKLALNSLFIYGLKINDLIYVELASIISQSIMLIIGLCYIFNKKYVFRISFKTLSLDWNYVRKITVISAPLFLGKFVISFGKVSVNAMCKVYGSLTVGALGISNNICGVITNPGASLEDSESGIVSQNLGNKNMKRCLKVFFTCCVVSLIWTTVGYLCVRVFFEDQIIGLFNTKNTSQEFVDMIKSIFFYDSLSIPALAINSVILGILYGYGQTFLATINNLLRIGTRIFVLWFLQTYHPEIGAEAAGISMGISNIVIAIFAIIILVIFLLKIKFRGYKGMKFTDDEPDMVEVDGILIRKEK